MGTSQIASLGRGLSFSEVKHLFDTALDHQVTTTDIIDTGMSCTQGENSSVFSLAKKDQIPVALNEVLKPYNPLLENAIVVALF